MRLLLAFVMTLFIAILVVAYLITRQANPVFLDDHGRPVASETAHH